MFEKSSPNFWLDPSDAYYVDVIHTDIKTLPIYSNGINQVSGHCDYSRMEVMINWDVIESASVYYCCISIYLKAPYL